MKFYELFSKRQKRIRGEVPDVYQCETIPTKLRIQIIHIWSDVWGQVEYDYWGNSNNAYEVYRFIHKTLCREYGMFSLGKEEKPFEKVINFFLDTKETEKVIDVIEFSFRCFDPEVLDDTRLFSPYIPPDKAINELNNRFREHGVGYQYKSGQIIRVDSQLIHSEAVRPTLKFLSDPMYKGANEEFLKAHGHYRNKNYKDCVNNCLNAFESCLKIICRKNSWNYNEKDSASRLIAIVFDNGLIPPFMQSHFSALRSTLESGVPTVRNNWTGHGKGPEEITVPEYMAAYILHLTASNILFLAKADEELK